MMLKLKNVSKYYSTNGLVSLGLRNINLEFEKNEIVAITGDSGSGKSTLLNVITGVDTYEDGEIYFLGNETSYFNQDDMDLFRKNNVSFIFQNYNIIDSYTVLENVTLPLLLRGKTNEEAKKEAIEILEKVGLKHRINHKGTKLSGGEKQRCVIARALASDSKILACDEPTGNLDSKTGDEIIKLIKEVATDKLVLIVTHNYEQVAHIATRKIKIYDGEVIEDINLREQPQSSIDGEIDLETKEVKTTKLLGFAFKNILSTPKKTIFAFAVFFVISFAFLMMVLMMMQYSYEIGFNTNNDYLIVNQDKVVAYNHMHQKIDESVIENIDYYELSYNNFYEKIELEAFIKEPRRDVPVPCYYTEHQLTYTMVSGNELENDSDILFVLPSTLRSNKVANYTEKIGKFLNFTYKGTNNVRIGQICGVALSDEVYQPYIRMLNEQPLLKNHLINSKVQARFQTTDGNWNMMKSVTNIITKTTYISCPKNLEGKLNFDFLFGNLYPVLINAEIRYEDKPVSIYEPYLVIGDDFASGSLEADFNGIYEATIFTKDTRKAKEILEKANISVTIPSRNENAKINLMVLYVFIAIIIVSLSGLFFIAYVVLSRVYASKGKDYGIFRTLGMIKKQLGKVVIFENLLIASFAAILALISFLIINNYVPILYLIEYLTFGISLLYFAIVVIFAYLIALRFNKKLFKFSVNSTLKEGAN